LFDRLQHHVARRQDPPHGIASAVLVPIGVGSGGDRLLFTKRSAYPGVHGGQVSFPGGKRSPGDVDLIATALREASEEIGLAPQDVEVLGTLDDVVTPTGFTITPVVGRFPWPYPFRPDPREIDRIVSCPLADLLVPGAIAMARAPIARAHLTPTFTVEGEVVWGATARVTQLLIDLIGPGEGAIAHSVPDEPVRPDSCDPP
jgi:8-oxo-dGTP pyrophosphatase MutT (NUDIX family)